MPFQVLWLPQALENLADLVEQVAAHDLLAAADLYDDLWHAPDSLTRTPVVIHKPSPFVAGQREIVVRPNYIVLYELDEVAMTATVTAVYHARQLR
ncbi:type II toxin-antitoxin system RelE/ParE family toxin [uncultured Pseudacidovorax sp.]|uniref:type II toxin-antitoxin system RelE/ParE family toxin n=1 Tax=uncultured Pseudacidovorax sp. TaxID=679313 RepID=UPI0025E0BA34|nr:type II toxin-antitoxin system RelE/ParE family toxin [uncultured Pseudacidovorax sp.]